MVDLLPASVAEPFDPCSGVPNTGSERVAQSIDPDTLQHTILNLADPTLEFATDSSSISVAASVVSAFQRLVAMVNQLRSPQSGWTADQASTPETLAPYLVEEAQDVLDLLCPSQSEQRQLPDRSMNLASSFWRGESATRQNYCSLNRLTSWMLWAIARSSPDGMRLLEGCLVKVHHPEQGEQSGILRLVPLLLLHASNLSCTLDLATYHSKPSLLPADRRIELKSRLCPSPITIAELTQLLTEQSKSTTPAIDPFFQGISTHLLIPGQTWHCVSIQLAFGFEFIPMPLTVLPSVACPLAIKFTNPDWLTHYTTTIAQHTLYTALPHCSSLRSSLGASLGSIKATHPHMPSIEALVADACRVADHLQNNWAFLCRCLPQQELDLSELAFRLLWGLMYSAYEVMQWMSGVQVKVLQPQSQMQTGILRFSIYLNVQTPESDWTVDLMTGRSPDTRSVTLSSEAIVQSVENQWCHQPTRLDYLEKQIWQQIYQMLPELELLQYGAAVDLHNHPEDEPGNNCPWQPGILLLGGTFDLIVVSEGEI